MAYSMTGSKNWVDTIPYLVPSGGISDPYPHDKEIHTLAHYFLDRSKAEKADLCIFGVPYDGDMPPTAMVSSRAGPDAIRNKLRPFRPYSNNLKVDISSAMSLVDLGDIDTTGPGSGVLYNTQEVLRRVEMVVSEILRRGKMPLMFGGSHTSTYGAISALCKNTKGNVGAVYFDAHLDISEEVYNDRWYDGCPVRRVLEIGPVKPKNVVIIGARDYAQPTRQGWKFVEEAGVNVFTPDDIEDQGIVPIVKKAIDLIKDGTDAQYLSVDIDSLDTSAAPGGAGWPIAGGLTNRELLKAVRMIAVAGVNGYDIMEVSPHNDPTGITACSAAAVAMEMIGGFAKTRVNR
jgi:agmatinase